MFDDDDDLDELVEEAFEWGALHLLHSFAWHAACGRIKGVRMVLGMRLIDAIKNEEIDEVAAAPYVDVLSEAHQTGKRPRWH